MHPEVAGSIILLVGALAPFGASVRPNWGHQGQAVHAVQAPCGITELQALDKGATLDDARALFLSRCQESHSEDQCASAIAELWHGRDLTATLARADADFCHNLRYVVAAAARPALLEQAELQVALESALSGKFMDSLRGMPTEETAESERGQDDLVEGTAKSERAGGTLDDKSIRAQIAEIVNLIDNGQIGDSEFADAIARIGALQRSKENIFPLELVDTVEFSNGGNTSYIDILLPNFNTLETFFPYSQDEINIHIGANPDLNDRTRTLIIAMLNAAPLLDGSTVHSRFYDLGVTANSISNTNDLPWVQGAPDDGWETDQFAGQLIGHTLLASLLETTSKPDEYVFDLGGGGNSNSPIQVMKRKVIGLTPSVLLRAKGYLRHHTEGGLSLERVDVYDPDTLTPLTIVPESGAVHWQLAKMVLMAQALYVIEGYHTGIHLFASSMVSAIKKSFPAGSDIGEAIKPQTVFAIMTMFAEAESLHNNHSSALNGKTWPSDSIYQIWEVTRDMARFYMENTAEDFIGTGHGIQQQDWWAGMSHAFIDPIRKFAASVSAELVTPSNQHLANLQTELHNIGLISPGAEMDVTSELGFARAFENLLFVSGICHTHMYSTREFFTPLMGWVSTIEFWPYLTGVEPTGNLDSVLSAAFPGISSQFLQGFQLMYSTGSGFSDKYDVPQLGDGPYHVDDNTSLADSIATFQAELASAREAVFNHFGPVQSGSFAPGYYYPKSMSLPFGFGITQTVYI